MSEQNQTPARKPEIEFLHAIAFDDVLRRASWESAACDSHDSVMPHGAGRGNDAEQIYADPARANQDPELCKEQRRSSTCTRRTRSWRYQEEKAKYIAMVKAFENTTI
jgi:hypothetical protein